MTGSMKKFGISINKKISPEPKFRGDFSYCPLFAADAKHLTEHFPDIAHNMYLL